ncbi:MAG: hypothetical protein ACK5LC_08000 [Coprobacillaceae bacterium]
MVKSKYWFKLVVLVEIMIPKSVKIEDVKNVVINSRGILLCLDANAIARATMHEIKPKEITLEIIYSLTVIGETAIACKIFSLFSSNIIAPIKNRPNADGSE